MSAFTCNSAAPFGNFATAKEVLMNPRFLLPGRVYSKPGSRQEAQESDWNVEAVLSLGCASLLLLRCNPLKILQSSGSLQEFHYTPRRQLFSATDHSASRLISHLARDQCTDSVYKTVHTRTPAVPSPAAFRHHLLTRFEFLGARCSRRDYSVVEALQLACEDI